MTSTNYARLSEGLHLYRNATREFIGVRMRQAYPTGDWFKDRVLTTVHPAQAETLRIDRDRQVREHGPKARPEEVLDVQHFNLVVSRNRDAFDRAFSGRGTWNRVLTWLREVGDSRNEWAHPPLGDSDPRDVDRILDTCERILEHIDPKIAEQVAALREGKTEPAPAPPPEPEPVPPPAALEGKGPVGDLKPWREVITPHPDVQGGRYIKAEFAADLQQVHDGRATSEYGDPAEFFGRTFVTGDMRRLLKGVVERLHGNGGDPVYDLKTAFGGGKTHTMLAVYHLARTPEAIASHPDVQAIFAEAGGAPPQAAVAVLVGTHLDPNTPSRLQEDTGGVEIHTLWGEMAWQLAGMPGYQLVADHDAAGSAPGSAVLERLFELAGPSVVLIDELVAYLRSVPTGRAKSPSGNYGTHITFFQTLTEAAKKSPQAVVLASIPESRIEYGDESGAKIADQISHVFQRIGAPWQPVTGHEAFEVVRRRLFGEVQDPRERDRTCEAYYDMYRLGTDFPAECREPAYLERMKASYPIHPEVFERLYVDWAANIDRFQRTRGVLRLMADVVYRLWERGDDEPLIMPGSVPLYDSNVQQQLVGYLGDNWYPPVDADIDGESSEAHLIERQQQRFGRIQACRRLTRTIFLGSVPGKANVGLEVSRIMLGGVEPGEGVSVYGDALRTLQGRLSYLHGSDNRYWFEVRPNLNRVAADRISRQTDDDAIAELRKRINQSGSTFREKGDFAAVHPAPHGPADVDDEPTARLVVLGPESAHRRDDGRSPAIEQASAILESRGSTSRIFRNMLVFAAPDAEVIASALDEARRYLGWQSITADAESEAISLDGGQKRQAERTRDEASTSLDGRLQEAYRWLLVPEQEGANPIRWNIIALGASGELGAVGSVAKRASHRLVMDGLLVHETWSPLLLTRELDQWIWKDGEPHVSLKRVWEYLATYPYFTRLRDVSLLKKAVETGVRSGEYFAYADGVDGTQYRGLVFGEHPPVLFDDASVLVRADVAAPLVAKPDEVAPIPDGTPVLDSPPQPGIARRIAETSRQPNRFFGTVRLNTARVSSSAGQVGDEIIQHLNALADANVEVTLEIHASTTEGIPENVVRIVSENAKALKFEQFGFEED